MQQHLFHQLTEHQWHIYLLYNNSLRCLKLSDCLAHFLFLPQIFLHMLHNKIENQLVNHVTYIDLSYCTFNFCNGFHSHIPLFCYIFYQLLLSQLCFSLISPAIIVHSSVFQNILHVPLKRIIPYYFFQIIPNCNRIAIFLNKEPFSGSL